MNGIEVYNNNIDEDYEEKLEDFINGKRRHIVLVYWDAWEGCNNKARTQEIYEPWIEKVNQCLKEIEDTIKKDQKLTGKTNQDCDWDDGYLYYNL